MNRIDRRTERYRPAGQLLARIKTTDAEVVNLSLSGALIHTKQPVPPSAARELRLFAGPEIKIPVRIVSCKLLPGTGPLYEVALEFTAMDGSTRADLARILQHSTPVATQLPT